MEGELPEPRRLIASALRCLASFERLASKLYEELARKTSNRSASLVFEWLSIESGSHATLLDILANPLEAKEEDCAKFVGLPWRVVDDLIRETRPTERISDEALAEILQKLRSVEGLASEEIYGRIMVNLLKDFAPLVSNEAEIIELILEEVSEEEKYHEKLLLSVARALEQRWK